MRFLPSLFLVVSLSFFLRAYGQNVPGPPAAKAPVSTEPQHGSKALPQVVPTPPTQPGTGGPGGVPATTSTGWARARIQVAPAVLPPHIDGNLDDACWRTATHAAQFYRSGGTAPITEPTEAWICADANHLFFAFRCRDSHPNLMRASETRRDSNGVQRDDYINIDIDSQSSRRGLSSFYVTPRGTQQQFLEGGTADNIVWAGDWQAATQRAPDGWTCEISIPFALLRYPRGTRSFAIGLFRKLAREGGAESWPFLPPEGWINGYSNEAQYLNDFTGIAPPFYRTRPIFLPYTLATGGVGSSVRAGLDVKYPLTTTLTGVATLFPDFQTVEQDVTDINFSYTEKLLSDRRPFFAEGADFFPGNDLFYSRRLGQIDGGLKVAGKQGATTLGLLSTVTGGSASQTATALHLNQDVGLLSRATLDFVSDIQHGNDSNQAAKLEGVFGWQSGRTQYALQATHAPSWQGGRVMDSSDFFQFSTRPQPGHLRFGLSFQDIGPDFVSNLGFVPEKDLSGESFTVGQSNRFDQGWIESYGAGVTADSYQHHTGGFFHSGLSPYIRAGTRAGQSLSLSYSVGRREQFRDRVGNVSLGWGQKTLYQSGSFSDDFGRQAGKPYNFLSLSQGFLLARPLYVQLDFSRLRLGDTRSTQNIVTGTYRLNDVQSLGGRLVSEDSATNVYFSFGQHVRTGNDVFLLFGDPNSARTRGKVTLKVVRPF